MNDDTLTVAKAILDAATAREIAVLANPDATQSEVSECMAQWRAAYHAWCAALDASVRGAA